MYTSYHQNTKLNYSAVARSKYMSICRITVIYPCIAKIELRTVLTLLGCVEVI